MSCKYWLELACATVLVAMCGCSKDEPREQPAHVDPPSVYTKDPVYAAAKAKVMSERVAVVNAREMIVAEMEARWNAARAQLPEGASAEEIEASLANDPEWISLRKRLDDAQQSYADNLKEAQRIIGERIAPKRISK